MKITDTHLQFLFLHLSEMPKVNFSSNALIKQTMRHLRKYLENFSSANAI